MSKAKVAAGLTSAAILMATPVVLEFEGTIPYGHRDPVNIATACTGHTGPEVVIGKPYTKAECDAFLRADLNEAAAGVQACIHRPITLPIYAALISFTFNVGQTALCNSTLARMVNAGDYAGGCAQLSRWVFAKGHFFRGLFRRRGAERQLCEAGL